MIIGGVDTPQGPMLKRTKTSIVREKRSRIQDYTPSGTLSFNDEDAEAWNNLGNCLSRLAEGPAAIEAYTRAVALKSDYAEAFYNKANAHFIEEEDERAIAYAELALQINPDLNNLVSQWINVSRDRLASKRDEEEHLKRISSESKKED